MRRFRTASVVRSFLVGVAALTFVGCTAMTGESAGRNIDDATITASVKAKLARDQAVGTLTKVNVTTTDGVVSLNGVVGNNAERARAARLANEVNGVRKVDNNLQVIRGS